MLKLDQITHQSYFVQRSFGFKKWLANLMRKCFKNLIGNFSINTETTLTLKRNLPLVLVLLYLGSISPQTRNKFKKH